MRTSIYCSSLIAILALLSLSLAPAAHAVRLENPVELGFVDTQHAAYAVFVVGGLAYVADGAAGLRVIDVSDPADPVEVGFIDTPGTASSAVDVTVVGGLAYVADESSGLHVIDVSDPVYVVKGLRTRDGFC